MPTSAEEGKDWARQTLRSILGTQRVLDVGAGCGTWGRMVRELIPLARLEAIEVWEQYVDEYELRDVYDEVHLVDVRDFRAYNDFWDLTILGDVLEHMDKPDALTLWDQARGWSRWIMLSLPIVHWPQGAVGGNPYEEHVHHWSDAEVRRDLHGISASYVGAHVGVYLARGLCP